MISSLLAAVVGLAVIRLVQGRGFARDGKTPEIVRLAVVSKVRCLIISFPVRVLDWRS